MRRFVLLAFASLLVSMLSLSRELKELESFVKLILISSLSLFLLLLFTRKYWRDARRVG